MEFLEVTYRIAGRAGSPTELVESVLLEQTIETPRSVADRYPFVREQMLGSIREIVRDKDGDYVATLSLPYINASVDPSQFLNVLFGNSSLHPDVALVDFQPPDAVTGLFPGPQFGISGVRKLTGVETRPLTCSALKPVGLSVLELAEICRSLANAGIDLIKDDHYLGNQSFAPFEKRVRVCQEVVDDVSAATGRCVTYVANLSGTPDDVRRQADFAQRCGVRAAMVAPMLLGLPVLYELSQSILEVPVLAHPSFGGSSSIRPPTIFGRLFRLFGADAVIFTSFGGRFSYSPDTCAEIADKLTDDWMGLEPSFPVPAGGMDADRASELVKFFGLDSILLVGGSLLEAADMLGEKARRFVENVQTAAVTLQNAL